VLVSFLSILITACSLAIIVHILGLYAWNFISDGQLTAHKARKCILKWRCKYLIFYASKIEND
jgi:hypothetical protein